MTSSSDGATAIRCTGFSFSGTAAREPSPLPDIEGMQQCDDRLQRAPQCHRLFLLAILSLRKNAPVKQVHKVPASRSTLVFKLISWFSAAANGRRRRLGMYPSLLGLI
jgi:hypothetical protein